MKLRRIHKWPWSILCAASICTSLSATACEIAEVPCEDYAGFERLDLDRRALSDLATHWRDNKAKFANQRYLTIFDVTQHSATPRFIVFDTQEKTIEPFLAAHGKGSDPDHDGIATDFSDVPESKATPLGFFQTVETYMGRHGLSLRLDGLEERNKNARSRSIVIHGADYVDQSRSPLGRSWGCPALSNEVAEDVIDKIKGGSLLYIFVR